MIPPRNPSSKLRIHAKWLHRRAPFSAVGESQQWRPQPQCQQRRIDPRGQPCRLKTLPKRNDEVTKKMTTKIACTIIILRDLTNRWWVAFLPIQVANGWTKMSYKTMTIWFDAIITLSIRGSPHCLQNFPARNHEGIRLDLEFECGLPWGNCGKELGNDVPLVYSIPIHVTIFVKHGSAMPQIEALPWRQHWPPLGWWWEYWPMPERVTGGPALSCLSFASRHGQCTKRQWNENDCGNEIPPCPCMLLQQWLPIIHWNCLQAMPTGDPNPTISIAIKKDNSWRPWYDWLATSQTFWWRIEVFSGFIFLTPIFCTIDDLMRAVPTGLSFDYHFCGAESEAMACIRSWQSLMKRPTRSIFERHRRAPIHPQAWANDSTLVGDIIHLPGALILSLLTTSIVKSILNLPFPIFCYSTSSPENCQMLHQLGFLFSSQAAHCYSNRTDYLLLLRKLMSYAHSIPCGWRRHHSALFIPKANNRTANCVFLFCFFEHHWCFCVIPHKWTVLDQITYCFLLRHFCMPPHWAQMIWFAFAQIQIVHSLFDKGQIKNWQTTSSSHFGVSHWNLLWQSFHNHNLMKCCLIQFCGMRSNFCSQNFLIVSFTKCPNFSAANTFLCQFFNCTICHFFKVFCNWVAFEGKKLSPHSLCWCHWHQKSFPWIDLFFASLFCSCIFCLLQSQWQQRKFWFWNAASLTLSNLARCDFSHFCLGLFNSLTIAVCFHNWMWQRCKSCQMWVMSFKWTTQLQTNYRNCQHLCFLFSILSFETFVDKQKMLDDWIWVHPRSHKTGHRKCVSLVFLISSLPKISSEFGQTHMQECTHSDLNLGGRVWHTRHFVLPVRKRFPLAKVSVENCAMKHIVIIVKPAWYRRALESFEITLRWDSKYTNRQINNVGSILCRFEDWIRTFSLVRNRVLKYWCDDCRS